MKPELSIWAVESVQYASRSKGPCPDVFLEYFLGQTNTSSQAGSNRDGGFFEAAYEYCQNCIVGRVLGHRQEDISKTLSVAPFGWSKGGKL